MRYAIFTVSLPDYAPEEAVSVLRELGYEGVEWRVTDQKDSPTGVPGFWTGNRCTWPLSTFLNDVPRIKALTEQAGLAMPNLGTYVSCENLVDVETAMKGAAALGVPQLRVNVPSYDGKSDYVRLVDRAIGQYRDVAALARKYGVRALVEIHMGNITPSASAAAKFVSNFDPKYVGVIHDAGNMVYEGYEQYGIGLAVLGHYLAHVHVKNGRWEAVGTREDGSTEWKASSAPISKGIVDMAALLRALKGVGYDGWLSFEDFSTEAPLADRVRENIKYIKAVEARIAGER